MKEDPSEQQVAQNVLAMVLPLEPSLHAFPPSAPDRYSHPVTALADNTSSLASPSFVNLTAHDVAQQAAHFAGWDQDYVQLSSGSFKGQLTEVRLGGVRLFRETTNQVVHERGSCEVGSRSFCLPLRMKGSTTFRGSDWSSTDCATMSDLQEMDLCTAPELDVIGVAFDDDQLAALAMDLRGFDIRKAIGPAAFIRPREEDAAKMKNLLLHVFELVASDSPAIAHESVRQGMAFAISETVIQLVRNASDTTEVPVTFKTRKDMVDRVIAYVEQNPDADVTVAELCRHFRVSRRTLQTYFHDTLRESPLQYLRAYRLNRVRQVLRGGDLRVQDAAGDWGFWHLGQFSHDYSRLFGELPSATRSAGSQQAVNLVRRRNGASGRFIP